MAVVESNAPLQENKPTRQWDAWTREEEENFFGALRQVGKNFEKITSRVQTKNKDQVRHYYYRVIKRMNKILSPSLVLDAKNSSYVNSAMLRWWSLLEKHSCTASKLRLKPRRFKTFVTALEHQLLKDRKKPKKKSPPSSSSRKLASPTEASDGISIESGECTTSGIGSSKAPVDSLQSSQSAGGGRKTAVKRKAANIGSRISGARSEAKRPPRPRKKPAGQISSATSAAFSKLVLLDKLPMDFPYGSLREKSGVVNVTAVAGSNIATSSTPTPLLKTKDTWPPLEIIPDLSFEAQKSLALLRARCNNCSSLRCSAAEEFKSDPTDAKVKLQLYPLDDRIRKALEQDGLNPHLELTLKARKSISSVLNHLTQKWGRASVATGELRLFPFNTQWSSVALRQSWSHLDSDVSAADVHAALGNPAVFRLRYAWFPRRVLETSAAVLQQSREEPGTDALDLPAISLVSPSTSPVKAQGGSSVGDLEDSLESGFQPSGAEVLPFIHCEVEVASKATSKPQESAALLSGCGWLYESTDGFAQQLWNIEDSLRSNQGVCMTQMDWVDSLTNISVSELLGDGLPLPASIQQNGLDQPHLSSQMDTFDIPLSLAVQESQLEPSSSAIWGGEETCDAFSFQKASVSDNSSKETVNPLNHEICVSSLGLDTSFRNMSPCSWREQLQAQSQELLFGGEASLGLGGLIEALAANGSLDGFQSEQFSQLSGEMNVESRVKREIDVSTKSKEGNTHGWVVAPKSSKDRLSAPMSNVEKDSSHLLDNSANITSNLSEGGKNDSDHENIEVLAGSINCSSVSVQAGESDIVARPASCRPHRQKDMRQASGAPSRPFKLPGRCTNMRSLKLQT